MGFGALFYDYSPAAGRTVSRGGWASVYPTILPTLPPSVCIHAFWVQTKS